MEGRSVISAEDNSIVINVPIKLKRIQGRKKVITHRTDDGQTATNNPAIQKSLVLALARAHRWKELLETGRFATITELARAIGVDGSYVGRILRLTLLAPDIIESILEGNEPDGVSLERLVKGFPMEWQKQERYFFV